MAYATERCGHREGLSATEGQLPPVRALTPPPPICSLGIDPPPPTRQLLLGLARYDPPSGCVLFYVEGVNWRTHEQSYRTVLFL
jgi:hypothetical protein